MTSMFQRALGSDYERLHPELQRRFAVGLTSGTACIGSGVMDQVWHGRAAISPFLRFGARRHVLFPETGVGVPFVIENYPYTDSYGRETVTFARTFRLGGRIRRFDATMIYSPNRGRIVDFIGTHQHMAVDLDLHVDDGGGLWITTGQQRLREGPLGFRFPQALSGQARVHEWYDERARQYRIEVSVVNSTIGPLFGYRGRFTVEYTTACRDGREVAPSHIRPVRENPYD